MKEIRVERVHNIDAENHTAVRANMELWEGVGMGMGV